MTDDDAEQRRARLRRLREAQGGVKDVVPGSGEPPTQRRQRRAGGGGDDERRARLRSFLEQRGGQGGGEQKGRILKLLMERRGQGGNQSSTGERFPRLRERLAERSQHGGAPGGSGADPESRAGLLAKAERLNRELEETLRKLADLVEEGDSGSTDPTETTIEVDPDDQPPPEKEEI